MSNGYAVVDVDESGPGARRRSAALMPCQAPRSRRGLTSVHHSSVRRLRAEFARPGHELPPSGVCTMELAGGVTRAHSALRNARASAGLLVSCLDRVGDVPPVRLEVPRHLRTYAMQRSSTGGRT